MARLELLDTVELMGSSDYRDRFVAEYIQTKIRYEKLKAFNTKIEAARRTGSRDEGVPVAEPEHDCPAGLLREQQAAMGEYLHLLEVRAVIEDIDLTDAMMYFQDKKVMSSIEKHPAPYSTEEDLKNPEIVRLEDPELKLKLEECEDDWDIVVESVARILEKGLFDDKDEEKIFAASLNVLHKMKKLDEPCEEIKKLTPDEIKNGLENCISENCNCNECPAGQTLKDDCECGAFLMKEALEYIKKLEEAKNG